MKKIIISLLVGVLFSANIYSQIGIMTENPAIGTLVHTDARSNNAGGGAGVNLDDVVIGQNGNVGLGTTSPQTKLHIVTGGTNVSPNPQVKIEDGSQALNKVFMSDPVGAGQWSEYIPGYQAGTLGAGITHPTTSAAGMSKTNMQISLDPGQWLIFYTISMTANSVGGQPANYRFWIQVTLGESGIAQTADGISSNQFSNNGFMNKRSIINGWVAVDNRTIASKIYVLYVGGVQWALPGLDLLNVGDSGDGFSSIYAFRINMR